ncbi:hypothetical protein [Mucilaginibacter celer]|uniref:Uncharacterized protein n=1 Tax=Mucilaginibacter celer TaxID=2305508 RepID=A0A494VQ03_9SPHI|nr:hypothetical protein [Mucilaginibacter celer]AYL95270.1 hypothetical protein HYN43_008170 [Mucilaginibacter celer]
MQTGSVDHNNSDGMEMGDAKAIGHFIKSFDQTELLAISAALQLEVQNHGKNTRLEEFTDEIIRTGETNGQQTTYKEIQKFFQEHLLFDYMEDPTVSYFVENVVFFGGNYRVLPGINTDSTENLNNLLEGIFMTKNDLSVNYKEKVRQAAHLLLIISEAMVNTTSLPRYSIEEIEDDTIHVPQLEKFNALIGTIRFNKKWLGKLYAEFEIDEETITHFLITKTALGEQHDPFESALYSKPFFDGDDEIICLIPATITKAIADYIKTLAKEMDQTDELSAAFFKRQWKRFYQYADEMGWALTDIKPPAGEDEDKFIEGVFQIDLDKFAYVQLLKGEIDPSPEKILAQMKPHAKIGALTDPYTARYEQVSSYLNAMDESRRMKVLTLFIGAGIGGTMYFVWPKPNGDNQTLFFSFADFEKIVFEGQLEPLSLWKYAKAVGRAGKTTRFGPGNSSLDNYVYYQQNGGSLLPRDETPGYMTMMGVGTDYQRQMVAFRDEHAARLYRGRMPSDIPVKRNRDYAPIYTMQDYTPQNILLIESYGIPIWIMNTDAKSRLQKIEISLYTEAVAFWLYKMTSHLKFCISSLPNLPAEVYLDIDRMVFEDHDPKNWLEKRPVPVLMEMYVEGQRITIEIPLGLGPALADEENNDAERAIMGTVLKGFNILLKKHKKASITEDQIEHTIREVMSPGHAKMILVTNSDDNPFLDNRGLSFERHINDADKALIDDYLVPNLDLETPVPENITDTREKNSLCMKIVNSLIARISKLLTDLDAPVLLKHLVLLNEHLLHEAASNDLRLPHQIACYSDFPTAVKDLYKKNSEIVPTALAVRGLIEFIAAAPTDGKRTVDLDTMDELIALMSETIHWANVADCIALELNDPGMGLLPSGRMGMSYEFFRDYLQPFSLSKTEREVYHMMQQYGNDGVDEHDHQNEPARSLYNDPLTDNAFLEEWGISLSNILLIQAVLRRIGMGVGSSFMVMNEEQLITAIQNELINKMPDSELKTGLTLLSLQKRPALGKAPKVDISEGLTRLFRALWSTGLCKQLRRLQLIINKLVWSKYNKATHPNPFQPEWSRCAAKRPSVILTKRKVNNKSTTTTKSVIISAMMPLALCTPSYFNNLNFVSR